MYCMNKETIGCFVKYQRKRIGLTQSELGQKLKRRRQAIIELEKYKCDTSYKFVEDVLNCLGFELTPVKKGRTVKPTNRPSR